MSGIYGITGSGDLAQLRRMGVRLRHRGEIASEFSMCEHCWLGGRSSGPDPGGYGDEDLVMVTDATLYDSDPLRAEIESHGYRFSSTWDSETIFAAYRVFGTDAFARLHGGFAVALWDARRQRLILTRDRFGIRPLHYWQAGERVIFASEYKAILSIDDVPAIPDLDTLQRLQFTKFTPANQTLLQGIRIIQPGRFRVFASGVSTADRYWQPSLQLRPGSQHDHAGRLRDSLCRAVERRVVDLDKLGVELSGGIDSTAIVGAVCRSLPELPLYTFTAGYGPDDPEILRAEFVAEHCHTIHQSIIVEPDHIPARLPGIVRSLEDPVARSEVMFYDAMARAAAPVTPVIFGGYSSDNMFGGMPKHKLFKLMQMMPAVKGPLGEFYDFTQSSLKAHSPIGRALTAAYFRGQERSPAEIVGARWSPTRSDFQGESNEFINTMLIHGMDDGWRSAPKVERTHIAHGVTLRYPFLDLDVFSTAFSIPDRYKIRRWREKYILREAVRPLLPQSVLNIPKFPARMNSDLAFSDVIEEYGRSLLRPADVAERGFFQYSQIAQLLRRPNGKPYAYEHAMRIWTIMATELWARAFLDNRGAPPAEFDDRDGDHTLSRTDPIAAVAG
ncbi:MAG: asparagine synthase-related protein [Nitrolancea sp.]